MLNHQTAYDIASYIYLQMGWLVVWNMNFIFHNIWDVILPIDELIFFKMVETTNQVICHH